MDVCEHLGISPGAMYDDWDENRSSRCRSSRSRRSVVKKTSISEALLAAADEAGDDGLRIAVGVVVEGLLERVGK